MGRALWDSEIAQWVELCRIVGKLSGRYGIDNGDHPQQYQLYPAASACKGGKSSFQ